MKKKLIIVVLLVLLVVLAILIYFFIRNTSNNSKTQDAQASYSFLLSSQTSSSKEARVLCYSDAETPLAKISGFTTELAVRPVIVTKDGDYTYDISKILETKVFGLDNFNPDNYDKLLKADVFYRVKRSDGATFTNVTLLLQICDMTNMRPGYLKDPIESSIRNSPDSFYEASLSLHSWLRPNYFEPSKYRIDAYAYVSGTWYLTDRMDNITLTD